MKTRISSAGIEKIRRSKIGSKNPMWKGTQVGYAALHEWVRNQYSQPLRCDNCHYPKQKLDLANRSQKYKRDLSDWEYLCRKCHMKKDGRLEKLTQRNRDGLGRKGKSASWRKRSSRGRFLHEG